MTPMEIIQETARGFDVTVKVILAPTRGREHVALARQTAMRIIRSETGLSYPAIGDIFGRHHSTVIHACRKFREPAK